jgi:hypothetical protein
MTKKPYLETSALGASYANLGFQGQKSVENSVPE